ncbi:FkbM family methyltransferase [Brevundimonas vesicularis]|uniref:FkbM family methyltransferase n=1 Tax=Brevundimonas vesicularis TaxID=41276 RepID=UPI0022EC7C95|nr:FkbM family methyltransferase [Brevundimonas vesicularis]WBT06556.1 FkbM family methyltransferase [Brevundimonas vesicularis]
MAKWPARIAHLLRSDIAKGATLKVERPHYFYLGESLAMTKLRNGHFIYVDPLEESVCSHLIAHGDWEPWIYNVVMGLVGAGDHVVEVGGHVGFYTLGLASKVGPSGSVLTFEANPRLAALASRSLRFGGYAGWAKVVQKAVSDKAGTLKFALSRQFGGGGHLYIGKQTLGVDGEILEVEAIRLDDLELGNVRLLRIDAEGSEALILGGATKLLAQPNIIVCMEWDLVQMRSRSDPPMFVKSLTDIGFRFWKITTSSKLESVEPEAMLSLPPCDVLVSRMHPSMTSDV